MGKSLGIVSLIFGIIGLSSALLLIIPMTLPIVILWYAPLVFSVVAIICGGIGIKKDDSPGLAIAGLILGIIGITLWLISFIMSLLFR
ncbi:MAG: hypothetical protein ACFFBH_12230 [Promethearchaeota archaeon]